MPLQTETEDGPADTASVRAALLEHANRYWEAEVENAERYSKHSHLLMTMLTAFSGALLYRLSQGWETEYSHGSTVGERVLMGAPTVIIIATYLVIEGATWSTQFRWLQLLLGSAIVVLFAAPMFCGTCHDICFVLGKPYECVHAMAFGIGLVALLMLAIALWILLRPSPPVEPAFGEPHRHPPERPLRPTSSSHLALTDDDL